MEKLLVFDQAYDNTGVAFKSNTQIQHRTIVFPAKLGIGSQ